MAQKKKLTLYLPEEILKETQDEADRQDRSISWLLERAWLIARDQLQSMPGVSELTPILPDDRIPRR
jgi:uncharacterized small protein (TIGR04563 family)